MNDDLLQMLQTLKLRRMAEILPRHLAGAETQQPSYREFLAALLREQVFDQRQRRLAYRIERARLPQQWALETFPFNQQPGVKAAVIWQLAELDFIARATNIVFIGATGVGKACPGETSFEPTRIQLG